MMNTEGNNGNKPSVYGTSFPSALGQWWGGDLRAAGAGCVANGSLDLGRLCFGGIVAMFSGYAYARLGRAIPAMAVLSTSFVAD